PFVFALFFDSLPLAFNELQRNFRRDRPSLVICGLDFDPRIIPLIHDVVFSAGKSDDATARADETRAARHFATRGVSDFSFDAVLEIERLILISLRDLEWNLDPALRIEPHVAIFHHVVAVTVITTFIITLFTLA